MAYVAWSVVFGETPSAAKWNILGTNDASFNDGTGIAALAITSAKVSGLDKSLLTVDSNPYKFSVYRNAAANSGNSAFLKIDFDTELFDTNGDFAGGAYTVPINGFYLVTARIAIAANLIAIMSLFKGGVELVRMFDLRYPTASSGVIAAAELVQLAAGDVVDIRVYSTGVAYDVSTVAIAPHFTGVLVSRT